MALTNEEIIFNAQMELAKQGKIGSTGRMITLQTDDGEIQFPEPEAIHTFAGWKERGYKVKKGEHAVAKFGIWKYAGKQDEEEKDKETGYCFIKQSHFFAAHQVERSESA